MPNTIAHFALNGLLDKRFSRPDDLKWLFLGCIVPDIPWIAQRLVNASPLELDPFAVRGYFAIQASLMFCVLLSAFIAFQVRRPWRVFTMLCIASLVHLLLDATQIKWGNGVNLAAPFDWVLLQFGWFWPESIPTYLITLIGAVYFCYRFAEAARPDPLIFRVSAQSRMVSLVFLLVWCVLPPVFQEDLAQADAHYLSTWKNHDERSHQPIEFDRTGIFSKAGKQMVASPYNQEVALNESIAETGSTVSIRGHFSTGNTVIIEDAHVHSAFRDHASKIGIVALAVLWSVFLLRTFVLPKFM